MLPTTTNTHFSLFDSAAQEICIYLLQNFQTGIEDRTESFRMRIGGPFQWVKRFGHHFRSLFLEGKNDSKMLLYSQWKKQKLPIVQTFRIY